MALVSGFLRQKCTWTPRTTEFDPFGQPVAPTPQEIKCRWVCKAGWARGSMGESSSASGLLSYRNEVMTDRKVREGDSLTYEDGGRSIGGVVQAVQCIVDIAGKEQGRVCYV